MIKVRNLIVERRGTAICTVPRFEVAAGERVALVGPNGSGKSTLLRVLAGLEADFSGQCLIDLSPEERTFVHQEPWLFRGTVLSNVTYGLRARGKPRGPARQQAHKWLERMGVTASVDRSGEGLSGGEKRRVALARALVLEPRLLLLDEPFSDLDAAGIEAVTHVLRELPATTLVLSSHVDLPDSLVTRAHRM